MKDQDAEWGYEPGRAGMATEAKMGMGIVVILVSAFAFLVYHKVQLKQQAQQDAIAALSAGEASASPEGQLISATDMYAEFQPTSTDMPAADAPAADAPATRGIQQVATQSQPVNAKPFDGSPVTTSIAPPNHNAPTPLTAASDSQPAFPDFPSEPALVADRSPLAATDDSSNAIAALELQEARRSQSPTSLRERVEPAFDALPQVASTSDNDGWRGSGAATAATSRDSVTFETEETPTESFAAFGEPASQTDSASSSNGKVSELDNLLAAAAPQSAQAPDAFQDAPFEAFGRSTDTTSNRAAAESFDAFADDAPIGAPSSTPDPFADSQSQKTESLPAAFADSFSDNERSQVNAPAFDSVPAEFSPQPQLESPPTMVLSQQQTAPAGLTLPRFPEETTEPPVERTRRPEKFVGMPTPAPEVGGLQDAQLQTEIARDTSGDVPFGNDPAPQESAFSGSYDAAQNFDNDPQPPRQNTIPPSSGTTVRSVPVFPKPPQMSVPSDLQQADGAGVAKFTMPHDQQPRIQQVSGRGGHCEVCEVQLDDNYWTISRRSYGTARYFSALALYNQDRIPDPRKLRPGMKVLIPEPQILEERYPELFRDQQPKHLQPAGFFLQDDGTPAYRVGERETLSEISQKHLGRASRWIQIYRMNQNLLKDPNSLKPGTVIVLPDDATNVHLAP